MKEEILHITNGDYFNNYFTKKIGGLAVPFREVIMDGEVVDIVYSDEFIKLRAKTLNVSENDFIMTIWVHRSGDRNKKTNFGSSFYLSKTEGLGMASIRCANCMELRLVRAWHHAISCISSSPSLLIPSRLRRIPYTALP